MSDALSLLRRKNPNIRLYNVLEPAFHAYGCVLACGCTEQLDRALRSTPIPESGNMYAMSDPVLEETDFAEWIRAAAFGGMDIQLGFCNGRGCQLNALEYHKCGEVNYSTTGCVLLMARQDDLKEQTLDSRDIVGFYLPPGIVIEVHPEVFHFAPCRTEETGFNCLVVLEKGVNMPLHDRGAVRSGEAALLWMRGKWLIAHGDSPQAGAGAYVGILGENIQLHM